MLESQQLNSVTYLQNSRPRFYATFAIHEFSEERG